MVHIPRNVFRINEWFVSKVAPIMGIVYLALLACGYQIASPYLMLLMALLTACGFAAFGYFLNDMFDVETDRLAGKPNSAARFALPVRIVILLLFTGLALLPWYILPWDTLSVLLISAQFLAFILYTVPPFRFKKNPFLSIAADALYAHAIPVVLAFHTFSLIAQVPVPVIVLLFLFGWQLLSGVRYFLNHLALDRHTDSQNGICTVAVLFGNFKLNKVISHVVLPAEIGLFLCLMCILDYHRVNNLFVITFAGLFLTYLLQAFFAGNLARFWGGYSFKKIPLDFYYQAFFPMLIVTLLLIKNSALSLLLLLHLLLFTGVFSFLFRFYLRSKISYLVNHGIYYFRKWILFYSEQKARKEFYHEYALRRERENRSGPSIAIVNINKNKYTETFVSGHVTNLPCKVYFYFGGSFPTAEYLEGPLLNLNTGRDLFRRYFSRILGKPDDYFFRLAFLRDIQRKNVRILLAEFGTVGVNLTDISCETGIPLVVIFYGYDAYHRAVIEENRENYATLFKTASKIIAVSLPMLKQLASLGAPSEKLTYLPCYIDLNRFTYSDHSRNELRFLAVGRFAETKGPHLTLLAFHQVWQAFPQAKLIMVGKDGGGELFEACHILVKALKIESAVEFKGILSPDEVYAEMQHAYAFVQHSVTTPLNGDSEGTPVAVMEAMACGLPVVATRHAGIADMIENGVNGLLVEEYEVNAMADSMKNLAKNPQKARELGQAAATHIHEHPLVNNHIRLLWDILKNEMP